MPRRNYLLILGVTIVSLVCYRAADPLARSFADAARTIQQRYLDQVDGQSLWSAAVRGMLSQLGDPYSEYINPQQAAELEKILNQEFAGIGIQIGPEPETGRPQVISPIVGSPAYKAGILAGDIITQIDGQPTRAMKYADAAARIRGKADDTIRLTIERPGTLNPIEFSPIRRAIINVESVLGDERNTEDQWDFLLGKQTKIAYLRITNFGEHTANEVKTALDRLKAQGMQALILDLRDNPGGLLRPAAIGVCDLFIPEGKPIVSIRGRGQEMQHRYVAGSGDKFLDFPMAVLINRFSASASEIVAACLQDNDRATIIGERSYGKGTVQNLIPLENQSVLKLTTAQYIRPSGRNIQRQQDDQDSADWGVQPDEQTEVQMSKVDQQNWAKWRRDRDIVHADHTKPPNAINAAKDAWREHDPPLRSAVEYLESQVKTINSK